MTICPKRVKPIMNNCELKISKRYGEQRLNSRENLRSLLVVKSAFDEDTAIKEAKRCLVNNSCKSCDLCRYFCPDLCITRNENTGQIEIDYDFCKGCGICTFICPKGAITMVTEE